MIISKSKIGLSFLIFCIFYNITYGQKQDIYEKKIPIVIKLCDKYITSEFIRIDIRGTKDYMLCATTELNKNKEASLIINKKNIDDILLNIYAGLPTPDNRPLDQISLEHLFQTDTILVEIVKPKKQHKRVKFIALISFLSKKNKEYAKGFFVSFNFRFKKLPKKYREDIKECMKKKS